jgi:lipopolysaccharide export system permease protein
VLTSSTSAKFDPRTGHWALGPGDMHVISDTTPSMVLSFSGLDDRHMRERPIDLMAKPRDPQEMRYSELSRFIRSLERSGGDANLLRVERALKIAIPVTCLVIALFGAPLATSTQRGGTAYGIGLSLAITVTFLMLIQLTKPLGGKNIIWPDVAAWLPNALFAVTGLVLLARVRT